MMACSADRKEIVMARWITTIVFLLAIVSGAVYLLTDVFLFAVICWFSMAIWLILSLFLRWICA